ncbi:MAG: rRNA maturation RNase YbeY [Magnetococcales bacterium]|nr:rRNA maturation RNase YbeY [Magnetococcales bacterium]
MTSDIQVRIDDPAWTDSAVAILERAITATLAAEGLLAGETVTEVSVLLTGDEEIQRLNRQFRNLDRPTNVLSFPMEDAAEAPAPDLRLLGDLVLSHPTIARQAPEWDRDFVTHLSHLAIHGTLHLLGYDHERSPEEELRMTQRERDILQGLGFAID